MSEKDDSKEILNIFRSEIISEKVNFKIIEALFCILYKKELINKKEYNLLIAQLNHKLHEIIE